MKTAAIYARVSSHKQQEENTIARQTAALTAFAAEQGDAVPTEWIFEDEGYSGATLERPGLEQVRDLAAEGQVRSCRVGVRSRPVEPEVCLPNPADRGTCSPWCRNGVSQGATDGDSGGPTAAAVPGHDRGIRAGANPRTIPPRQAPPRAAGAGQRAQRSALWLSLRPQE